EVDCLDFSIRIPDTIHETIDTPNHVSEGEVDDEHPKSNKEDDGGEFHAFSNRSNDQSRSDDGKHHLIHGENVMRNPIRIVCIGSRINTLQEGEFEVSDERASSICEHKAIPANPPQDADQARDTKTLSEHRENVFPS